jgi:hypothetical protein
MISKEIQAAIDADREQFPKGINKPLSWCSEHDCKMGTCFPLHYPESVAANIPRAETEA